ncbi:hypothetical protein LTR48_004452 [Friedmanniomyces endolithicus]|nr:hypothetical protein LTR48_004452 [Friedmanniomyces endolithicus]
MSRPTTDDLTGDHVIAQLARKHWLVRAPSKASAAVLEIWEAVEAEQQFALLLLEQLQALERYLWPGYSDESSNQHVLLIALLVNVKRAEQLPVWSLFADRPEGFTSLFRRILHLSIDQSLSTKLRTYLLVFLVGAFQSLDSSIVRKECAPLVSIGIWHNLHDEKAIEERLAKYLQVQKAWRAAGKKYDNADAAGQARLRFERSWLYTLLLDFLDRLYDADASADRKQEGLLYCERALELLCDLLSQLPTRRYVNTLLQDMNLLSAIKLSPLYRDGDDSSLLRDLHQLLQHYAYFPVDDQTGKELSRQEYEEAHNASIARLQNAALKIHPEKLKILVLANYGSLSQRAELLVHVKALKDVELVELTNQLGLRTTYPEKSLIALDRPFFEEVLASNIEQKPLYSEIIQATPLLPTEHILYEQSNLRIEEYNGAHPLAVPKLNLQYLTLGDFLWRSFTLYRSESFYEDTIKRLQPRVGGGITRFDGFSKMAIPIGKPAIIQTQPPRVGEDVPAEVQVEVSLDVSRLQPSLRREWESLRQDDVVYLLAVHSAETERRLMNGHAFQSSAEKVGLKALRCAEVMSVLDENGRMLRREQDAQDNGDGNSRAKQRRLLLRLDAASYKTDKEQADVGKGDVYDNINLIVRRRGRENNFKPVLESIRQLTLAQDIPVPAWLQEVFLGFGDPSSASYKRLPNRLKSVDYRDTFIDWQHLIESLPGKTVEPDPAVDAIFPPPYVLEAVSTEPAAAPRPSKKRRRDQPDGPEPVPVPETLRVTTYKPPNNGPYPADAPKLNTVRFTPAQLEAITSGTQPGLTIIVGPPGTGKTDVATQIISNIYHNFPQQRTLLVAHSNQALNQLFQKIVALDIDERHLLRLGHGEEELVTETSFSKAGRVESFVERGGQYLAEEIANLGFKYDNVIMEEAAQVTEAESFIPFVMQDPTRTGNADKAAAPTSLQRIVLIGDHLQNSPVIQTAAFRSYANLEQSLFQRLLRLGVPHILLDAQGRSRPSIAELYKWRYPLLTNLPFTSTARGFTRANAGFRHEYQFIDVGDYKGQGETEPSPHFIQNLGEAEYAVALFQYMRLLGYPGDKISILCAYAGQRALIRDVLAHRCKGKGLFGLPGWVGTVDKYQGEQNDYVILSLVRTKRVGYLRDVRRLTVALSRARLGLYVLGRREVFEGSLELREALGLLFEKGGGSGKLEVVTGEMWPASRGVGDQVEGVEMEGVEHLGQYVHEMAEAKMKALREGGRVLPPVDVVRGANEMEEDGEGEEEDAEGGVAEDEEVPDVVA